MIEREKSNKHWLSAAERVARIKRGNHISAENCTERRKNVNPQIQEAGESQPSQLNKNIMTVPSETEEPQRQRGEKTMISVTDKIWVAWNE